MTKLADYLRNEVREYPYVRGLYNAADALDAAEKALADLADTIPADAPAYAIGPKAAAAQKQARAALAKLRGDA